MTPRERTLAILDGKPVDHLPRLPILMQYAAEWIGSDYGRFTEDYRILTDANRRCAAHFGFDQLSTISDPYRETEGFGAVVTHESGKGAVCRKAPLEDSEDLSILKKPDPEKSRRMRDRVDAVKNYRNDGMQTYSVMGWVEGPAAEAADLRGVSNFMVDLMDNLDFASSLMDLCVENALRFASAQIAAGADTIGIGDAVASQVSAALYEKYIQPREKILVDAFHARGAKVRLHICGNITHLLPGIAKLGVDILDVDHLVDLAAARRAVGRKTALCGNLDPVAEVKHGNPEAIRLKVETCYERVGNPFMVGAGCEIPSGTPEENLKALCHPVAWKPG
jgi:MtaA/CmuA family methyltransferase